MDRLLVFMLGIFSSDFGICNSYRHSEVFPGFKTEGFFTHWSYSGPLGPHKWSSIDIKNNQCGKRNQSPINIPTQKVAYTGTQIKFLLHNQFYYNSILYNNGHTVNLTIDRGYEPRPQLQVRSASGYVKQYIFDSIHFHFGANSDRGSEHFIDNRHFAMEMHSIYYKDKYGSFNKALNFKDGLAVVSVLYYVSPRINLGLSPVTNLLKNVVKHGEKTTVPRLILSELFPSNAYRYFHYHGSLTTPPCSESVQWYILKSAHPIAESQLQEFRKLENDDHDFFISDNNRPIQPQNERTVYMHF